MARSPAWVCGLWVAVLFGCASREPAPRPEVVFGVARTPVVFRGVVLERLPSPRVWCGIVATFQGVRYRVDTVESGPMEPGEHVVYHALVGPPLCERDEPVLSREIFRVGQRLRVECERTDAGAYVGWERAESVQLLAGQAPNTPPRPTSTTRARRGWDSMATGARDDATSKSLIKVRW